MGYINYAPRKYNMSVVGRSKVEKIMKFILVDEINENVESINVRNTTAYPNFVNGNDNDTSMDVSFKNAETLAKAQLELLK